MVGHAGAAFEDFGVPVVLPYMSARGLGFVCWGLRVVLPFGGDISEGIRARDGKGDEDDVGLGVG